jgi:hypothetical protein
MVADPLEVCMHASLESSGSRRRALRRAVRMECETLSALWDDTAALVATNLSPQGLWLGTELPLEVGEQLVVSFRPPRWPEWSSPLTVLARVARVGMPRRRGDAGPAGMGLCFVDLEPEACVHMTNLLRGLPPPLPVKPALALAPERVVAETSLLIEELEFELCAEAPLLTAGRSIAAPVAPAPSKALLRSKHSARRHKIRVRRREKPAAARRAHLRLVS